MHPLPNLIADVPDGLDRLPGWVVEVPIFRERRMRAGHASASTPQPIVITRSAGIDHLLRQRLRMLAVQSESRSPPSRMRRPG